ncbi:MAG: hypothetical protein WCA46_01875 [Actinocatenispora sp.]
MSRDDNRNWRQERSSHQLRRRALARMGLADLEPGWRRKHFVPGLALRQWLGVDTCEVLHGGGYTDREMLRAAYRLPQFLPEPGRFAPEWTALRPPTPPTSWADAIVNSLLHIDPELGGPDSLLPDPQDPSQSGTYRLYELFGSAQWPEPPSYDDHRVGHGARLRHLFDLPPEIRAIALAIEFAAVNQQMTVADVFAPQDRAMLGAGLPEAFLDRIDTLPRPARDVVGTPVAEPSEAVALTGLRPGASVRALDNLTFLVRDKSTAPSLPYHPQPGDTWGRLDTTRLAWLVDRVTGSVRFGNPDESTVRLAPMPYGWAPGAEWPPSGAILAELGPYLPDLSPAADEGLRDLDTRYTDAVQSPVGSSVTRCWQVALRTLRWLRHLGALTERTFSAALVTARCPVTGRGLVAADHAPAWLWRSDPSRRSTGAPYQDWTLPYELRDLAHGAARHDEMVDDVVRERRYTTTDLAGRADPEIRVLVVCYTLAVAQIEASLYGTVPTPRREALTRMALMDTLPQRVQDELATFRRLYLTPVSGVA